MGKRAIIVGGGSGVGVIDLGRGIYLALLGIGVQLYVLATNQPIGGPAEGGAIFGLILLFGGIAASWALPGIGFEFGDGGQVGGLQVLLGMALALLGVIIAVRGLHRFLGESEADGF